MFEKADLCTHRTPIQWLRADLVHLTVPEHSCSSASTALSPLPIMESIRLSAFRAHFMKLTVTLDGDYCLLKQCFRCLSTSDLDIKPNHVHKSLSNDPFAKRRCTQQAKTHQVKGYKADSDAPETCLKGSPACPYLSVTLTIFYVINSFQRDPMPLTTSSCFKLSMPLIPVLAFAAITHAMPLSSFPINHLPLSDSSPGNLTCYPNNIAVDTTIFVQYAAAFCADITGAPSTLQDTALMPNHTLTIGVNSVADAVKCQVDPEDCANAMHLIRKTCTYPFPRQLVLKIPSILPRCITAPGGRRAHGLTG